MAWPNANVRSLACASAWKTVTRILFEEVGREFGVTRERIRQIEKDAAKLRHPSRSSKLKDYLED